MTTAKLTGRLHLQARPGVLSNLRRPNWRVSPRRLLLAGALGFYAAFALSAGAGVTALLLSAKPAPSASEAALSLQQTPVVSTFQPAPSQATLSFGLQEVQGGNLESSYSSTSPRIQALRFQPETGPAPEPEAQPPQAPVAAEDGTFVGERVRTSEDGTVIGQRITAGKVDNVNVTFYDCLDQGFCGTMYNGGQVYEGAAACSWNLPIGTRFFIHGDPTGRILRLRRPWPADQHLGRHLLVRPGRRLGLAELGRPPRHYRDRQLGVCFTSISRCSQ